MPSASRNDPCPCGSGKKAKKCCQNADAIKKSGSGGILFQSDVDQLSNATADAIEAGKFDEAEALCAKLTREFPDQLDGCDRFAMLREAQARYAEAAEYYAQALKMIADDPKTFGEETRQLYEKRRQRALRKADRSPRSAP